MTQTLKLNCNNILKEKIAGLYKLIPLEMEEDIRYIKVDRDGAIVENKQDAYTTDSIIKKLKLTEMNAEGAIYVRSGTVLCGDDYDVPLFTYDMVEAVRRMFIMLDIVPWRKTKEYREKYVEPMKPLYESWQNIPVITEAKQNIGEWGREFDSGYKLYIRCEKQYEPRLEEVFKNYLDLYVSFLKDAKPVKDPAIKKEIMDYKERFKQAFRENDPAAGPSTLFFGHEWTERAFKDFPF